MEKLISDIREIFQDDHINTMDVRRVLENYKSNRADWQKYAHFDPHKYTRNLVDIGNGKFNLLILCWGPGTGSSIHDHTDAHCFVKVLEGSLLETRFAWPETCGEDDEENAKPMVETGSDVYTTNGVTYISDNIGLHRMENPSHSDPAVTLHLYIPPFEHCQIFDQRTGKKAESIVTFYTKYGQKVDYSNGCKEGRLVPTLSKIEEESEEKDTKEKDKLGQGQVQRHRRAESELKREPEQSDEEQYMAIGIKPGAHSQFAFRHHHRKRQAPTHDHNYNKEGEPVGDIKDANVWTEKSAIVSRKRRGKTHRHPEADSEEKALDKFAELFFANIGSIKTGETHNSKYDDTRDQFENMIPLSRQPRHVTGEEHTHSREENTPKLMWRKRRAYNEPKGREEIRRGEESDINRWNLQRRRYPTGGIGPSGHERVLPLPVNYPEYPQRTNGHAPPYKPKYPDPNNDF
ncbi:cysteine dioxygenase type I domain-containing protein [Ditylenchus destructor]|uniref:cysteine dioxygenase n=1 Tax=Ditylenchus destructor TaxID=166010 RepID=A0AAD4NB52_9BILA|nr:cysteine dioxygenase type I domain-containing protein [Ditylenchus destructor]